MVLLSELQELQAALPDTHLPVSRFRPNIVVDDLDMPAVSTDLLGKTLTLGNITVTADIMATRCAMTIHAQGDLARAPEIMRILVKEWKHCFGIYVTPVQSGEIAVGDTISLSA